MPTLEPLKSGYYIWKYVPSQALSIVALLLWLGAAGTVSWRMYKTRTWFCTAFVIGCFSTSFAISMHYRCTNYLPYSGVCWLRCSRLRCESHGQAHAIYLFKHTYPSPADFICCNHLHVPRTHYCTSGSRTSLTG